MAKLMGKNKGAKRFSMNFAETVHENVVERASGSVMFGYLKLPHGVNLFKETPGSKELLDFLPYEVTATRHPDRNEARGTAMKGTYWYKLPFKIHRNIGPMKDAVVCPKTFHLPCPICDYRQQRIADGAPQSEIDSLRPSKRVLYAVVPRGNQNFEEKLHIWNISNACFQKKLDEEINEKPECGCFPDPDDGYTLAIRFSEEVFQKNKFASTSRIDFEEREAPIEDAIVEKLIKLDDVLNVLPNKELSALFFDEDGVDVDSEEDAIVEEVVASFTPQTRAKKAVAPVVKKPEPEEVEPVLTVQALEVDEEFYCVACAGTGLSTKGGRCAPCRGTGVNQGKLAEAEELKALGVEADAIMEDEVPFDDDEEVDVTPPAPVAKKPAVKPVAVKKVPLPVKKAPAAKLVCPFADQGLQFGVDVDVYDCCAACALWDKCIDAKEGK